MSAIAFKSKKNAVRHEDCSEKTPPMDTRPLMPFYEHIDEKNMQDFWYLTALIAEQSLLQSGAVPRVDYCLLDLYKIAQPFVLEQFKKNKLDLVGYESV